MNLYPHDCSYLFTEYGRRKEMECYDIEMRERDDGEQEGNEYMKTQEVYSLFSAQDTNKSGLKR
jgi:hypothetical protein